MDLEITLLFRPH